MNSALDEVVRRADPDRWLASRFIADPAKRADVIALYAFDYELRRAVEGASNPILAEIRLTWWSEVLDQIYTGVPVRLHPTAQALELVVRRRSLPREPLEAALDARLYALEGDRAAGEIEAAEHITEAAALALDAEVNRDAARVLGRAWAMSALTTEARAAAKRVSAAAFPAVAHAALAGRDEGELLKRLRLTWSVARGRV